MPNPDWSNVQTNPISEIAVTKAVNRASYSPNHSAEEAAPLVVDKDTGALLVYDLNGGGGGGGGTVTEYTEDAAAAANPVGPMTMLRRKDTLSASEVSADGDNIAANGTSKGEQYVAHAASSQADGHSETIGAKADAAASSDTGTFSVVALVKRVLEKLTSLVSKVLDASTDDVTMYVQFDDVSPATASENGLRAARGTATGDMHVNLRANDGSEIGTASAPVRTDPTGTTTQPVSASSLPLPTGASTSAKQDTIIGHVDGIETTLSSLDGKVTACNTGAVTISAALPAGTNAIGKLAANAGVTIGAVELAASQTLATVTTVSTLTGGGIAHDTADSGNPVKVGAKAIASLATTTIVAGADRTDAQSDLDGALLVRAQFPLADLKTDATSNTDGASTASTVFTAVASTRNCITAIHVFRTDAGTTPIYVDFRDGTGGSVLYRAALPPNGGSVLPAGATPYFKTTANTALAYDVSAATTTVYINVTGFQSKVT